MLLKYEGINLNFKDKKGKTAFMHAVIDNNPLIVNMLLNEKSIRKNLVDGKAITALDYLNFKNFKIEIALLLIKNCILNSYEIFYGNAKNNYLEDMIRFLMNSQGNQGLKKDLLKLVIELLKKYKLIAKGFQLFLKEKCD